MCPTSIAVRNWSVPPHSGHRSPSLRLAEVGEARIEVAPRLDPAQMPAVAVRAGDELPVAKRLVRHDLAAEPDRAERAADRAERGADLVVRRRPRRTGERVEELRLARAGRRRGRARAPGCRPPSSLASPSRSPRRRSRGSRRAPRSSSRRASRPLPARRAPPGRQARAERPARCRRRRRSRRSRT